MGQDRYYMRRALELSQMGASLTHPNPMVGAVIVKDGVIIGEGWHHGPGLLHAEVEAIQSCTQDPKGATMYVTLEPCNHWGKTPPCTEAIIKADISEVKIAVRDCNNHVCGGGFERLQAAGIKVEIGIEKASAIKLNRSFFYHCKTGRPWVIMKSASSLDGKITSSNGESQWITGESSRRMVHQLRSQVGAVLIGIGTLLADNPLLTNRMYQPILRQPLRIILDSELRIPLQSNLVTYDPGGLLIFCNQRADQTKVDSLRQFGVHVITEKGTGKIGLTSVLDYVGSQGIRSILIEGGAEVFAGFLQDDLINEFYLFQAPFFIGGKDAKGVVGGAGVNSLQEIHRLSIESISEIGEDILIHAFKEALHHCLQA